MARIMVKRNTSTHCIFWVENDIWVHIGNIDTLVNRIYTTRDGWNLIATNELKTNHRLLMFEEDIVDDEEYNDRDAWSNYKSHRSFSKFNACVDYRPSELYQIINNISRVILI